MNTLTHIRNFLRIDDRLATSGMPQPDDFAALRQAGFDVVINLALPTSAYGSAKLSIRQKPCELSNRTGTVIGPDCWDLTRRISCQ